MVHPPLRILAINPHTRYLGFAVFQGGELIDWGVKTFKGRWSKAKLEKIKVAVRFLIDRYGLDTLAIKELHPSRSSEPLAALVRELNKLARKRGLESHSYTLQDLKSGLSDEPRLNKKALAERLAQRYPIIARELAKEQENKNPYFYRMFEAVALGSICHRQNENNH